MSLADVLFLMGFAAAWGGVVGFTLGTEREANRFARNLNKFTLPPEEKP